MAPEQHTRCMAGYLLVDTRHLWCPGIYPHQFHGSHIKRCEVGVHDIMATGNSLFLPCLSGIPSPSEIGHGPKRERQRAEGILGTCHSTIKMAGHLKVPPFSSLSVDCYLCVPTIFVGGSSLFLLRVTEATAWARLRNACPEAVSTFMATGKPSSPLSLMLCTNGI